MPKVIVLDNVAAEGLALLDAAPGIEYEVRTGLAGDDLRAALAEFDGAVCRSGVTITADSLEGNTRLKAIVRAGVGTDNIDKPAATRAGIVVMNTPGGNTVSTAEHAFALMMALSRNIAPAFASLKEGRWDRKKYMGAQLADKTLGVIGLGRIGQEVASRARAFQMKVIGFDPFLSTDRAEELGITLVANVSDMLPDVDYLTVHTPLTPETENLIDQEAVGKLKKGARLINAARGGIYNEEALAEGLKSGHLGGVALDVYASEPCTDSPLFGLEGVVCTPHLGASTEEAQTQVAVEAAQLLINFLTTGEIRHAVNTAALDPKTLANLKGYLNLADRLGQLAAQLNSGSIGRCKLQFRGDVGEKDTRILAAAFCTGLLSKAMDEGVNIVNAELLMKERGIELNCERSTDQGAFRSAIRAEITAGDKTCTVSGTLFGNDMPRLIRVNDFRLEAYLDGTLLVFFHQDVPGIIGKVGTIFGQHGVNIAQMSVGRASGEQGGPAVGILNLDSSPPQEALEAVLESGDVTAVRVVNLPPAGELPAWLGS